jgi:glutamate--cysteine ligase catalytic subunit
MGLLSEGQPLNWIEIKAVLEQIQTYAVDQLIRIYNKCKNRQGDAFTWGDEVYSIYRFSYLYFVSLLKLEFTLVRFDHANKKVRLLLKGHQLLPILIELNDKIDDE